jgi:hypothetical protein
MLSEQVPNEIECRFEHDIGEPGFVIACTDGAYAYFATGVHFELALWEAIEKGSHQEREAALAASIQAVTQDDTSLVLVPIGFGPERSFVPRKRLSELRTLHTQFENYASALRGLKPQVARLETELERMRENMQAKPAPVLDSET